MYACKSLAFRNTRTLLTRLIAYFTLYDVPSTPLPFPLPLHQPTQTHGPRLRATFNPDQPRTSFVVSKIAPFNSPLVALLLAFTVHAHVHTHTYTNTLFLTCFKSSAHIRWQSGAFIKPDRETQPEINFHAMMAADCRCMGVHFASQQAAAHTEPMMAARTPPQRLKDFQWRQ